MIEDETVTACLEVTRMTKASKEHDVEFKVHDSREKHLLCRTRSYLVLCGGGGGAGGDPFEKLKGLIAHFHQQVANRGVVSGRIKIRWR